GRDRDPVVRVGRAARLGRGPRSPACPARRRRPRARGGLARLPLIEARASTLVVEPHHLAPRAGPANLHAIPADPRPYALGRERADQLATPPRRAVSRRGRERPDDLVGIDQGRREAVALELREVAEVELVILEIDLLVGVAVELVARVGDQSP